MRDTVVLRFLEIVTCPGEDLCTCVLVDTSSMNRKIFLTLTVEEGRIVEEVLNEKNVKRKARYVQQFISKNVKDFIKNYYKVESAKIEVSSQGQIGILTLKKKRESFNLLSGIFTIVLLMLSENIMVFTTVASVNFCSVRENLYSNVEKNEKNDFVILENLDLFIEQENCRELTAICEQLKTRNIDIALLTRSV